jgi:MFS family permease
MFRKNYKWCVIGLLWGVCFLNYADRQAIFVLFPLLSAEFHLSNMRLALLGSSFMWMYALFGPAAGWLGDHISRKGLILAGLILWLGVTVSTILSRQYWLLVGLRVLSGVAEAVYFPAAMSMISDYHGVDTRSRAMSIHQSAVYAGTVGGGVLASLVAERFGWRSSFLPFGMLGVALLVFLMAFLKEPQRTVSAATDATTRDATAHVAKGSWIAQTLGSALVARLMVAFVGANFVAMILLVWLPSFLFTRFHMSLSMAGVSATVYLQVASIAGVLCGGVLADRMARGNPGGRMRTQALGLLAGAPFLFFTGWTTSMRVLAAVMIGFGFCKGIYDANIFASLHDVVQPEFRAVSVGMMNSLGWLGGGIAPLAMAAGSERLGMGLCLSATALIYVSAAGILFWNASAARACVQHPPFRVHEMDLHV